jgi:2-polyprenyl-3-methyl-5-hydroxy-6-metoxy-1,4-benzoquinol methylase
MSDDQDGAFEATYAELYDRHLVPLLFAPYARVLTDRAKALNSCSVLETAAGTGVVTRELAQALGRGARVTATDLNPSMIERAKTRPAMAPSSVACRPCGP